MTWDKELAAVIDHTILDPSCGPRDIEQGCEDALTYGFAAVVVHPYHLPRAAERLAGSAVAACSVVAFPFGAHTAEAKAEEARALLGAGAVEIDMVMNVGAFLCGDERVIAGEVERAAECCRGRAILKLIIETACLRPEQIARAATLGANAGADFIKTSTGYGPGGATPEAVRTIRAALDAAASVETRSGEGADTTGRPVAVKASGGIRTREFSRALLAAGATRLGCSASLDVIGIQKEGP